jgi:hypothetical protein
VEWRNVHHLDQQLAQHRPAKLATASDRRGGGVAAGVFGTRPLRQDPLGLDAILADYEYRDEVT